MKNRRIFVEKYPRFQVEAETLRREFNTNLGLSIERLRYINVYDLFGFSEELLEKSRYSVFGEVVTDSVTDECDMQGMPYLAVEYLPGQFDQRAASAVDCVHLIDPKAEVKIKSSRLLVFDESVTPEVMARIEKYFINAVESRKKNLDVLSDAESAEIKPVPVLEGFREMKEEELAAKLAKMKEEIGEAGMKELVAKTAAFKEWQSIKPTPEQLATIPQLQLSDLDEKIREYHNDVSSWTAPDGSTVEINYHEGPCNGIAYFTTMFDLAKARLTQEEMHLAGLLSDLIGMMDTEEWSYGDLETISDLHCGQVGVYVGDEAYTPDHRRFTPYMELQSYFIPDDEHLEILPKIFTQMLRHTQFTDIDRAKQLLLRMRSVMFRRYTSNGHSLPAKLCQLPYKPAGQWDSAVCGLDYYNFLQGLVGSDAPADALPNILAKLDAFVRRIFVPKYMRILLVCEKKDKDNVLEKLVKPFACELGKDQLPDDPNVPTVVELCVAKQAAVKRDGIAVVVPTAVNYVAMGSNFRQESGGEVQFHGSMDVVTNFIENDLLYSSVRLDGGAYGVWMSASPDGAVRCTSYRDPNVKQTLDVFRNVEEAAMKMFDELTEEDVTTAVIGAAGNYLRPLCVRARGRRVFDRALRGTSHEVVQRMYDETKGTTLEQVKETARKIFESVRGKYVCAVTTSEAKAAENADDFPVAISLTPK